MTTVDARERTGWLSYWLLPRADRRAVRRIERTSRALGDPRLDAIALSRLQRAARRDCLLHRLGVRRSGEDAGSGSADRLARLCSTMRHPSRTGICAGATPMRRTPRTS